MLFLVWILNYTLTYTPPVLPQQPVVQLPRRTETAEAPGSQGATTENIGNICGRSNAASRDASAVECSGGCTTGC